MTFEEFQEYIKNEYPQENCPVSRTLKLLDGKWTSRVIYELEKANQLRFGQLKKNLAGKAMLHIYYEMAKWGSTYLSN